MVSMSNGHLLVIFSVTFFLIGSYGVLFSAFLPRTGNHILDMLACDTHYKYFAVLVIPMTVYFVIANWVGWQYFRNS